MGAWRKPDVEQTAAAAKVNEYEMEERKGAEFVKWDTPGVYVSGVLTGIEIADFEGKKVPRFTVYNQEDDKEYAFLGGFQISQKLRAQDKGKFIEVRYEGDDPNISKGGNPMKVFRVMVSKQPAKLNGALRITDEDIPF